jgi:hypothetical protein
LPTTGWTDPNARIDGKSVPPTFTFADCVKYKVSPGTHHIEFRNGKAKHEK